MVDDCRILQPVMGHAADIDLVCTTPAAGEADVGLARLPRPVDHAADDGQRDRHGNVGKPLLQRRDRLDDVELLPRAGRAGDDVDAAPP